MFKKILRGKKPTCAQSCEVDFFVNPKQSSEKTNNLRQEKEIKKIKKKKLKTKKN